MDPSAQSEILSSSSSSPSSSLAPSEHFPGRKKGQKDGGSAFRSHPRSDAGPGFSKAKLLSEITAKANAMEP